jgi:hypothetical protein
VPHTVSEHPALITQQQRATSLKYLRPIESGNALSWRGPEASEEIKEIYLHKNFLQNLIKSVKIING